MDARTRRTAVIDPALTLAWEQLQVHYAQHQNAAPFWTAYQAIQDTLTRSHPHRHVAVCNQLAAMAERLGVVHHAQLLGDRGGGISSPSRNTGATPR